MIDETRAPIGSTTATAGPVYLAWGGIVAGALAASALSFILLSFGTAIGLALNSPSASWRDSSVALALLTGVWLLLTALASYGLAGYLAGRLRPRWGSAVAEELDFRDGVQGLLAWALATLIAAVLGLALANRAVPQAANSALGPTSSTVEPLLAFEVDRLFRSDRRGGEPIETDLRAQATRVLSTAAGHSGMTADDRTQLVRMVMARTGLAQPDSERRVAEVSAQARRAVRRARASSTLLAFMTGASLLVGAAAAWLAAGLGGRHRDGDVVPSLWIHSPMFAPGSARADVR
jgi:hypothetical protein